MILSKEIKHIEKSLCDDESTTRLTLEEHYESYLKMNGYYRKRPEVF